MLGRRRSPVQSFGRGFRPAQLLAGPRLGRRHEAAEAAIFGPPELQEQPFEGLYHALPAGDPQVFHGLRARIVPSRGAGFERGQGRAEIEVGQVRTREDSREEHPLFGFPRLELDGLAEKGDGLGVAAEVDGLEGVGKGLASCVGNAVGPGRGAPRQQAEQGHPQRGAGQIPLDVGAER